MRDRFLVLLGWVLMICVIGLYVSGCEAEVGADPYAYAGAAGGRAIDPADVGVKSDALSYSVINSNGGTLLSSEASHKKGSLRGYVMQWGSQGLSCTYNCPDGTACYPSGGSCTQTVSLSNCHADGTPGYTAFQICNVTQGGSFWGVMRYCQGNQDICMQSHWWFIDANNDAHPFGQTSFNTNRFSTP